MNTDLPLVLPAAGADFSADRVTVIERSRFTGGSGVMLAPNAEPLPDGPFGDADLTFHFDISRPGRYLLVSYADTCGKARKKMNESHSKYDSLRIMLSVDDDFARSRVIVSPWQDQDLAMQELQRCEFSAGRHTVRIRLPREVGLNRLEIHPYLPPEVPEKARNYHAPITPGPHPRIWITPETLPAIRANLEKPENRPVWDAVRRSAAETMSFAPPPHTVVGHLPELLELAVHQAFTALMTDDRETGLKAVRLMNDYLAAVEFDNLLDITRELGEVIYSGARVYDWCYAWMTETERKCFRDHLLRLADGMEIAWPPFGQPVVNGHGNEAQVNRDLLAMAIALFGEDDEPYRYCSWLMLEDLAPLRALEYRCDRHNQGVGYGAYRFAFEMHGVWMLRRMCGREVFAPEIKNVYNFWRYYLRPDGRMLQDGDGISGEGAWSAPLLSFMCYTYSGNPRIKGDLLKHGGAIPDRTLFLALNDPDLMPVSTPEGLPETHYFEGVIGSMIARTGWDSDAVQVEMKGGGVHFGNHQHGDAGNFQIFYRGMLAADLGMYVFYGTPYDFGYNKRSICHNVMLAYDPEEIVPRQAVNDGGQRFNQELPLTPEMALHEPWFQNGATLAADFGPDPVRPLFTYLKTDLRAAYSEKLRAYCRSFLFVRLDTPGTPGLLLVADRMTTARPEFKKYWLLNTFRRPEFIDNGLQVRSDRDRDPGKLTLSMLLPRDCEWHLAEGEALHQVFGVQLESPKPESPESNGFRTMISPRTPAATDCFVACMQIGAESATPLPIDWEALQECCRITLPGRVLFLGTGETPIHESLTFQVPDGSPAQLVAAGLEPGVWYLENADGRQRSHTVLPGRETITDTLPPGQYRLVPDRRASGD